MLQPARGIGVYLALFLSGAAFFLGYRLILAGDNAAFRPSPSGTTFTPPSQAIEARLAYAEGDVLQLVRDSDGFQTATPGSAIRQGESVATQKGRATVTTKDGELLSLRESSEATMANLTENAPLILLKSGAAIFVSPPASPLSVRARHTLLTLKGKAAVTIGSAAVSIDMISGNGRIGWIDEGNMTHVAEASSGETVRLPLP